MSHGHSHGGGGCRCAAEREEPPEQRGLAYGLYLRIDLERLQCLNESREGSGRGVFKPWEERTDRSKFVESDADEELLFNIPFTGNVKLKGIIIMGEDDDSHPSEMRLYKNIPQMSFDDTEREPDQTFSLNRDVTGELEYATKISRFSNVYHLSIHISKNFGADTTKIFYIGLRGEWTELRRHEVTICNYEASANPADHRVHQEASSAAGVPLKPECCVSVSRQEGLQLETRVPACSSSLSLRNICVRVPSWYHVSQTVPRW